MKIIISHFIKESYTVSYSVILSFKIFYIMEQYFRAHGYEVHKIIDFIEDPCDYKKIVNVEENFKLTDDQIATIQSKANSNLINKIKTTNEYNGSIMVCFHPKGYDSYLGNAFVISLLKSKGIKVIMWQDDLHAFNRSHNKPLDTPVIDTRLNNASLILTPSKLFFENQKSQYINKTIQYFYCFNELFLPELKNVYKNRKKKILLSGACYFLNGIGYKLRHEIYKYWQANKNGTGMGKYIDCLIHPSYNRLTNRDKTGLNYYKILSSYAGAFFGFAQWPQNYVLAKIIEILCCGTLGFFEYNPQLEQILGLIKFKHYVPILVDQNNTPLFNTDYYLKYLLTDEGERIATEGFKYAIGRFNMINKCDELDKIFQTINQS